MIIKGIRSYLRQVKPWVCHGNLGVTYCTIPHINTEGCTTHNILLNEYKNINSIHWKQVHTTHSRLKTLRTLKGPAR